MFLYLPVENVQALSFHLTVGHASAKALWGKSGATPIVFPSLGNYVIVGVCWGPVGGDGRAITSLLSLSSHANGPAVSERQGCEGPASTGFLLTALRS